jgi:hypothetical protein
MYCAPVGASSKAAAHQAAATVAGDGAHISKVHVDQTHFLQGPTWPQQQQQRQRANILSAVIAQYDAVAGFPPTTRTYSVLLLSKPCCGVCVQLPMCAYVCSCHAQHYAAQAEHDSDCGARVTAVQLHCATGPYRDDVADASHARMQHLIGLQEGLCECGAAVTGVCGQESVKSQGQE